VPPGECAAGTDTAGTSPKIATYVQAGSDAATFSAMLASLPATQNLSAIPLGSHGATTVSGGAGMNLIALPSITTGTKSTITINAGASEIVIECRDVGRPRQPAAWQRRVDRAQRRHYAGPCDLQSRGLGNHRPTR
jgi:hypothetical protein